MKELDEIRARVEAATPGPWLWSPELDIWGDCGPNLETVERGPVYSDGSQGAEETVIGSWGHDANGISVDPADAEFIAHAREDVPRLLAAIEDLLFIADNKTADNQMGRWWRGVIRGTIEKHLRTPDDAV